VRVDDGEFGFCADHGVEAVAYLYEHGPGSLELLTDGRVAKKDLLS
jgi:hypothetical protein